MRSSLIRSAAILTATALALGACSSPGSTPKQSSDTPVTSTSASASSSASTTTSTDADKENDSQSSHGTTETETGTTSSDAAPTDENETPTSTPAGDADEYANSFKALPPKIGDYEQKETQLSQNSQTPFGAYYVSDKDSIGFIIGPVDYLIGKKLTDANLESFLTQTDEKNPQAPKPEDQWTVTDSGMNFLCRSFKEGMWQATCFTALGGDLAMLMFYPDGQTDGSEESQEDAKVKDAAQMKEFVTANLPAFAAEVHTVADASK